MQQYNQQKESENDYRNYKPPSEVRKPTATNQFNEKYLYEGPVGLKRDYDSMFRALEYETLAQLDQMEGAKYVNTNQIQYYKNENQKFQHYFDKVLADNKVLYTRCKELEQYMEELDPTFRTQYKQIIQENEELRKQNYRLLYGNKNMNSKDEENIHLEGIHTKNRYLQLQKEIDDLKEANKGLKLRLNTQSQSKVIPHSYNQRNTQSASYLQKPSQSFAYSSPYQVTSMRPDNNFCDSVISANEHHNREVLNRCKTIVSSHNYS